MDVRVLKYFLAIAREGNITKAAEKLHITQPTLSRQIMDLEEELGVELLVRSRRQVTLTDSGILFAQRAREIVSLLDKTRRELAEQKNLVGGVVSIGCVESAASRMLPDLLEKFSNRYPMVQYDIYSANGDDIRDRIDQGAIDIGILAEPIETAKYDYIRLPYQEIWGVLMRKDDALAEKPYLEGPDILGLPLIPPRRQIVLEEIAHWLGVLPQQLHIFATNNLLTNTVLLVERGLGYAVCIEGAYTLRPSDNLCFVPFSPQRKTGHVLAWKKNRLFSSATDLFLQTIKMHFEHLQ